MKLFRLWILSCALIFAYSAQACIYKCKDSDGNISYLSEWQKGCPKECLQPLPTMMPTPKARNESSNFPKVDGKTQSRRDNTRRKILEDELDTEVKALEEARAKLKEAEDNPELYKAANGQILRNEAKYEEKVNAGQEEVNNHEKNIQALKTELSHLK